MGQPSEVHAELLRRATATALSDREVEKEVPLAQAFLAKARKGGNDGSRAEVAWERLRAWLDARDQPAAASSPAAPSSSASSAENKKARADLVKAMKAARSLEELDLVTALVFQGIAEGWIAGSESNRFVQVIESRRKTIEKILEDQARKTETGPRVIEVVYVKDWRESAPVVTASGTSSSSPRSGS